MVRKYKLFLSVAFLSALGVYFLQFLVSIIISLTSSNEPLNPGTETLFLLIYPHQILSLASIAMAAYLFFGKKFMSVLYLRKWKYRYLLDVTITETILLPAIFAVTLLSNFLGEKLGYKPQMSPLLKMLGDADTTGIILIAVAAVLLAPFQFSQENSRCQNIGFGISLIPALRLPSR